MNNTTSSTEFTPEWIITWGISATLSIMIVTINLLTILVIRSDDVLREKYGICLVSYCVADILNGLHVIYLQVRYWLLYSLYPSCAWMYVVLYSIDVLPYTLSAWHTVLFTFDRYIAVCYPFQHHKIMSPRIQKILIIVVWVFSIFENFAPQLYLKAFQCEDMIRKAPKDLDARMQLGQLTFISILHFIMYSRIWWIAHKMRQRSVESFSGNPPVRRGIVDKATVTVFCVVVLSYVIWIPYVMTQLIPNYFHSMGLYVRLTALFGCSGSFINNIIYVIINKSFRDGFRRLACKRSSMHCHTST